jgi:hypothetical protein
MRIAQFSRGLLNPAAERTRQQCIAIGADGPGLYATFSGPDRLATAMAIALSDFNTAPPCRSNFGAPRPPYRCGRRALACDNSPERKQPRLTTSSLLPVSQQDTPTVGRVIQQQGVSR